MQYGALKVVMRPAFHKEDVFSVIQKQLSLNSGKYSSVLPTVFCKSVLRQFSDHAFGSEMVPCS